jgi:hypothetical protein
MRERKRECGRLWRALDQQTKLKYKDIEFLKTLPNPFGRGECPGPDGGTSEASRAKNKKSRFYRSAETELWSRKVMLDESCQIIVPSNTYLQNLTDLWFVYS